MLIGVLLRVLNLSAKVSCSFVLPLKRSSDNNDFCLKSNNFRKRSEFRVVINCIESNQEGNTYAYPLSKASHAGKKIEKMHFSGVLYDLDL